MAEKVRDEEKFIKSKCFQLKHKSGSWRIKFTTESLSESGKNLLRGKFATNKVYG